MFIAITCPIPKIPNNGQIAIETMSFVYAIDAIVSYQCNSGFELVGSSTISCLSSSKWSESDTFCKGKFALSRIKKRI